MLCCMPAARPRPVLSFFFADQVPDGMTCGKTEKLISVRARMSR